MTNSFIRYPLVCKHDVTRKTCGHCDAEDAEQELAELQAENAELREQLAKCSRYEDDKKEEAIISEVANKLGEKKWLRWEDDISKHVYERVSEWIEGGMKKDSFIAFTAGIERTVARLCEDAIRSHYEDDGEITWDWLVELGFEERDIDVHFLRAFELQITLDDAIEVHFEIPETTVEDVYAGTITLTDRIKTRGQLLKLIDALTEKGE